MLKWVWPSMNRSRLLFIVFKQGLQALITSGKKGMTLYAKQPGENYRTNSQQKIPLNQRITLFMLRFWIYWCWCYLTRVKQHLWPKICMFMQELNSAADFNDVYQQLLPVVQSLPLLVHNKETVVNCLLSRVHMSAALSLEPILR